MTIPRRWLQLTLIILLTVLTACGGNTPPKGLAPEREIVKHAIARQLTLTENRLTKQLKNPSQTEFEIQNLSIKTLNSLYIADLPTYKISGTYRLKLNLPRQEITQNQNDFQVYLQRQVEGKTWRLLIPETASAGADEENQKDNVTAWASYLVT